MVRSRGRYIQPHFGSAALISHLASFWESPLYEPLQISARSSAVYPYRAKLIAESQIERRASTDTAGRTLTYSTSATSKGGGSVSITATTGAFTYTPTTAQRQAATGSTIDTFTVTASNGVRTTTQTVTVAVAPA